MKIFNSYQNMKFSLFLLISLLLVNVSFQNSVQCDGETIDKCTACNIGENSDSCSACEDGTFLFFHNLVCLPCNNSLYGQVGCGGKCNGTNFTETREIACEEGGCIDGYYRSYNGICYPCSTMFPNCTKCTFYYKNTFFEYKCLEWEDGNCFMDSCEICKFNSDEKKEVCEKCMEGFDINKKGKCDRCYNETNYYDRICYKCDTDDEPIQCWCLEGYYENPEDPTDCLSCPDGCQDCTLNKETNEVKCLTCGIGYSFNKENTCQSCQSSECAKCEFDENNNPTCLSCIEGYAFNSQNSCVECGSSIGSHEGYEQCSSCIRNEETKNNEDLIINIAQLLGEREAYPSLLVCKINSLFN